MRRDLPGSRPVRRPRAGRLTRQAVATRCRLHRGPRTIAESSRHWRTRSSTGQSRPVPRRIPGRSRRACAARHVRSARATTEIVPALARPRGTRTRPKLLEANTTALCRAVPTSRRLYAGGLRTTRGLVAGGTAKRLPVSSVLLESLMDQNCNTSESGPCGDFFVTREPAEPSKAQGRSQGHCSSEAAQQCHLAAHGLVAGGTAKRLPVSSVLLELLMDQLCSTSESGPCGDFFVT